MIISRIFKLMHIGNDPTVDSGSMLRLVGHLFAMNFMAKWVKDDVWINTSGI